MGISTSDGNYHEDPLDFYSAPDSKAAKAMTHSEPQKGPVQKPLLPAAADAIKGFNDTLGDLMTGRVDPASEEGIRKITPITVSTMGMGMFGAERGALGIFGGIQGMSRKPEQYIEPLRKYTNMVLDSAEKPSNFELHEATGLWEGLEGSPRFHIDASNSKLKLQSDNQLPTALRESVEKNLGKALDPDKVSLDKELPLHEVLDFPELYEHYPELKNMPIGNTTNYGYKGMYSPDQHRIEVGKSTPEDFHSTLIHEIQHAVQHIENHAFGGNPNMFAPKNMETIKSLMFDKVDQLSKDLTERLGDSTAHNLIHANIDRPTTRFTPSGLTKQLGELFKPENKDLVDRIREYKGHKNALNEIENGMHKMYEKLGGEVESRNAQHWITKFKGVKPFETEEFPREEQISRTLDNE